MGSCRRSNSTRSHLNTDMQIVVGQLYIERTERRFIGQIDEVAIYDRCLSPHDLRRHIKAAGRSVAPAESDLTVTD